MNQHLRLYACVTNDLTYDQRMQRMARTWTDAGYKVTMVGRLLPASQALNWPGIHTHRLEVSSSSGPQMYAKYNWQLYHYLRQQRPDIIVAADVDTLLGATHAAQTVGAKLVFDAHEWFTEVPELLDAPIKRCIWSQIERWGVKRADLCYTVNSSLCTIFTKRQGRAFHVIRNVPVLTDPVPRSIKPSMLLYQGALNVGRGLVPLIEAMPSLEGYTLHLAGDGDLSEQLRRMANTSSARDRIHFHGYVQPDELKSLTAQAYIGLNLLETTSKNYYYSLANKFFDYMHAGVPSLNMAYPEYTSILTQHACGATIKTCSPSHIISAIQRMSEPSVYESMVSAASEARVRYHWAEEQARLLQLFNQLH